MEDAVEYFADIWVVSSREAWDNILIFLAILVEMFLMCSFLERCWSIYTPKNLV